MVTEISSLQTFTEETFRSFHRKRDAVFPAWFERLRESAWQRFAELGFPSVKEEEWKYTNVAPLVKTRFDLFPSKHPTIIDPANLSHPETTKSNAVFIGGSFREGLSDLSEVPDGVAIIELRTAASDEKYSELVSHHLGSIADYVANPFTALNTAFLSSGVLVYVPRDVKVEVPLSLTFLAEPGRPNTVAFPRVLVVAEEGSQVTLIESYTGAADDCYFTNAVVEVRVKDNARVEHYKLQREGKSAFHFASTSVSLGRNSFYDATTINIGAGLSRHDIRVIFAAEGAECKVDGLYIVTADQHTDTHSVIDHATPHCTSHQLYKGILDGASRAVFNGKIFVRHDAQKTDALQTNKNLLLSNEARVDTKPQLEILADDVKCAHGAAVGQLDEDELFYLTTRGIHTGLARNLLTYGFAEEIIEKIKVESIRKELDEAVLNRLNARLEA